MALFAYPAQYEDIFKTADDQLYLAKNTGRNRVCLIEYSPLPGGIREMAAQLREGFAGALTDAFGCSGEEPSRVAGR
ncbi:hypothetical protein D9M72_578440 [compost metagenome]